MAVTYTGNLKLGLPTTGTESGTWGDVVNQQITTLLDQSVAGTVSLTAMTNTDYTLTNGNGNAANEARYMALSVPATLTLTAARNIIVPSTSKAYIIRNLTTGGFAVTLKTSAGGGISVPNGKTMILYCDGTNVIDGTDYFTSITLGTALPVLSGGTGVTTSTGTGAVVLNTSPTLVTPALGTPASGVVTNLTGTASININGTVGATTPTTGAFTTLTTSSTVTFSGGTANGVAYLNGSKVLTTGSALTFDGATLVNTVSDAGTALRLAGATGKVRVRPYVDSTFGAVFDSTNAAESAYLPMSFYGTNIYTNPDTAAIWRIAATEQMRLTSTGLGIGTSSPSSKFVVSNAGAAGFEFNPIGSASAPALYSYNRSTNAYDILTTLASEVRWQTGSSPAERMRLDASGNLGLGVVPSAWGAPTKALEIATAAFSSSTAAYRAWMSTNAYNDGTNWKYQAGIAASLYEQAAGSGHVWFNAPSGTAGNAISFTQAMTLDASGNLGLGVTPSAWSGVVAMQLPTGAALTGFSNTTNLVQNAYYDGSWRYISTAAAALSQVTQGAHQWFNAPSGTAGNAISFTQAMTLDASGNLLVGTTSTAITVNGFKVFSNGSFYTVQASGVTSSIYNKSNYTTGTEYFADFRLANTTVGSISASGSTTAYNTSSDYRLKNITGPITTSGAYIDSLKPVEGTWKADGSAFVGLIAHEVQEASRTTVATGTKDGAEMQAMDYSSAEIIANLIAELQSLRARVAQLEGKP